MEVKTHDQYHASEPSSSQRSYLRSWRLERPFSGECSSQFRIRKFRLYLAVFPSSYPVALGVESEVDVGALKVGGKKCRQDRTGERLRNAGEVCGGVETGDMSNEAMNGE